MDPIRHRTQRRAAELGHALAWTGAGTHAGRAACTRCGLTVRIVAGEHCSAASGPLVEVPCSAVARASYRAARARAARSSVDAAPQGRAPRS